MSLQTRGAAKGAFGLDKTDAEILGELRKNSRQSYRQVAQRLQLHPTTVISRLEKLEKAGIVRGFGVNVDLTALGFDFLGIVQVNITKGQLIETQKRISTLPGVVAVYDVTGECDCISIIAAKSRKQFSELIKSILNLQHVQHTNTQVILNVVKASWQFEPV